MQGKVKWWLQRLTAVSFIWFNISGIMLLLSNDVSQYETFVEAFKSESSMHLSWILLVFSLSIHAVIGLWSIGQDYLNERALGRASKWIQGVWNFGVCILAGSYCLWILVI